MKRQLLSWGRLNYKNSFLASLGLNLLLILALTLALAWPGRQAGDDLPEPALSNVDTQALRDNAADYGVSLAYLQLALPDYLVYSHHGEYVFQPLDPAIPRHAYDWSKLSYEHGRTVYRDESWPRACLGVDVSSYQGQIDWQAVAGDGIAFALIRLGYRGYGSGLLYQDEWAEANLAGAAEAGLMLGAYVFSQAVSEQEAVEEAELALAVLNGRELAFPVVFDMEEISGDSARTDVLSQEQVTEIARAFCRRIEEGGYQAMLYGNVSWLAARMERSRLTDFPVWLAQYYERPLYPYDFALWQYSSSGAVSGVNGAVDMDICFDPQLFRP